MPGILGVCTGLRGLTLSRWWKSASIGKMVGVATVEEIAMTDSVGQYLNEIGLVPLLTAQEERELSKIIEKGHKARTRKKSGEAGAEFDRAIADAAIAKDRFIR